MQTENSKLKKILFDSAASKYALVFNLTVVCIDYERSDAIWVSVDMTQFQTFNFIKDFSLCHHLQQSFSTAQQKKIATFKTILTFSVEEKPADD